LITIWRPAKCARCLSRYLARWERTPTTTHCKTTGKRVCRARWWWRATRPQRLAECASARLPVLSRRAAEQSRGAVTSPQLPEFDPSLVRHSVVVGCFMLLVSQIQRGVPMLIAVDWVCMRLQRSGDVVGVSAATEVTFADPAARRGPTAGL